jgi:hypothetical protein
VQAVAEPGALGQQLPAIVNQAAQGLQGPVATNGGQVGIAQGDPSDQQRVDRVGLGLAAASPARLGGELGWDLDHRQAAVLQGEGGLAAQAAGAFHADAVGTMRERPSDQLGVAGWVVGEAGVGDGPAVGVHGAGRQGVFVRVDTG